MIIKGGTIFQEDKTFAKKDIYIEKGRIVAVVEPGSGKPMKIAVEGKCMGELFDCRKMAKEEIVDATGLYVLPGLIDIHSHGAVGHDFSDGDLNGLQEILAYQCAHGVTSYCPTSMTLPRERLLEVFAEFGSWNEGTCLSEKKFLSGVEMNETWAKTQKIENSIELDKKIKGNRGQKFAHIPCLNMEGPFLDPVKKGAHREEDIIPPDVDFFRKCNEACGNLIGLVTVAPNAPSAVDFIREIKSNDKVIISLGHTDVDYVTAKEALKAGASHITHLFNAMQSFNHREPGLIGAGAEEENCFAELICDGVHVHESMVRAAFKLFPGRIVLISDSMRATGLTDGIYDLGGQQVCVRGNLATLSNGTIAGSVTNLFDCMRKAIEFGISKEEAVAAATMNPAKSIGIFEKKGSLTPGKRGDLILVDEDFNLQQVILAGAYISD